MANNILYVSDGDYGKRTGYIAAMVQGQSGQVVPLEIRDLSNNVVNLTGYTTITGRMDDRRGNVTSIDGTLALDATPSTAPQVNWTITATDTGTPGVFDVILVLSNGSATLKTIPVALAIYGDPAATVVPSAPMVAVTQAQATLLAELNAALPAANGDVFKYTAGAWETAAESGGGGAVSSVFARTGAVVAASGDYGTNEITDDSVYAKASLTAALDSIANDFTGLDGNLSTHTGNTSNPHSVTAAQAGALATANNLSELTATQATARANIGAGTGNGDVTAAANFDTDNRAIRADGTGKGVQSSGVTIDDSGNLYAATTLGVNSIGAISYSGNQLRIGNASSWFQIAFYTDAAFKMILDISGRLGIGVLAPTGKLHIYDTCAGWLTWKYDGVDGTSREVIPNGTGDVLYSIFGSFLVRDSGGTVYSGTVTATAPSGTFDLVAGALRLTVAADGSVSVQRVSGALTYKVNLWLQWL